MVNTQTELNNIEAFYSPKVVGEVNNEYIKLVKILGEEVPWHSHENEDECFIIMEGELLMEIENMKPFKMQKGDLFVVKKGVNHKVSSEDVCSIMLIESKTTEHTGKVSSNITKSIEQQLN